MKLNKKITLAALVFISSFSAMAEDDARKSAFYMGLSAVSHDLATDTFMLDQFLETRCGKPQSIEYLKALGENRISIIRALKEGKFIDAKARLASIPCEAKQ